MINLKQKDLIIKLIADIQKQFQEVQLVNVAPSPENPNDLWINVTWPKDEERQIELMEFSAEKGMDILLDYGYHMMVMPADELDRNGAKPSLDPFASTAYEIPLQ